MTADRLSPLAVSLPNELTSFVGRKRELSELGGLLDSRRIVTVVGSGGCGKTRLATRFARESGERWRDGACFVDLSSATAADVVDRSIATALGVMETPGAELRSALAVHLSGRQLLMILDNCEQVVDAVAATVHDLLQSCDDLVVLATSREPLGVEGETTYRVPSLGVASLEGQEVPDALQLFVDRAQAVRPEFRLTDDNEPSVREIARRLDGIPLAIELAAGRLGVLSPQEIAAGLSDRFRLLGHGARTAIPRQQTLLGSVRWSYDLLTDAERALLRRLSVFVAGCDLAAAKSVAAFEPLEDAGLLDVLARLADRSLLVVDATSSRSRYRMLETIRQFAAEELAASGELEVVRHRHLDHFLELVSQAWLLSEQDQVAALTLVETERENIYAAVDWALAAGRVDDALRLVGELWGYWTSRARFVEGRAITQRVVDSVSEGCNPAAVAAGMFALSWLEEMHGDYAIAYDHAEQALELAVASRDRRLEGRCLARIGLTLGGLDLEAGRPKLEAAIEIARETRDTPILHVCLCQLGWFQLTADGPAAARPTLLGVRDLTGQRSDLVVGGQARNCLALVELSAGDLDAALEHAEVGQAMSARTGNRYLEANAWGCLALARFGRGDVRGGLAACATGEVIVPQGRNFAMAAGHSFRGVALLMDGDFSAAVAAAEQAIETADVFGPWVSAAWKRRGYAIMARAQWRLGDVATARRTAEVGLELARRRDSVLASDIALVVAAAIAHADHDPQQAERLAVDALALAARTGMYGVSADALELLAVLAVADEDDGFAVWLAGAAARHRRTAGVAGCWTDPPDNALETARQRLGPAAYETSWAQGAGTPIEEAVKNVARRTGRRKRPAAGWPSLTPTEVRVVELAAEGLGNAAIAGRLFISRRTVDAHLTHIYAKLGLSSRPELVAAALGRK